MMAYYFISGFLLVLLILTFLREKKSRDDLILYLLVMIPLILRLLRVK
jgi:hypothetical protein